MPSPITDQKPLHIGVVMGLGEDPQGPCLGFRPFVEALTERYQLTCSFHSHTDNLYSILQEHGEKLALAGHSNGAAEILSYTPRPFVLRPRVLMVLDGVPEWHSPKSMWQWLPWSGFAYPLPQNIPFLHNFYGKLGKPFQKKAFSTYLPIAHNRFPSSLPAQVWFSQAVEKAINLT